MESAWGPTELASFFAERRTRFGPIVNAGKVGAIEALVLRMVGDPRWRAREHVAYGLATVHHETDRTYLPIEEYASGSDYEGRVDLGNAYAGDGVRFKGRGFVQLTGRRNYAQARDVLGVELVAEPELAKDWETAYEIMTRGMYGDGLSFTGKRLPDYDRSILGFDRKNARRVINGLDCWERIAQNAKDYEACLRAAEVA